MAAEGMEGTASELSKDRELDIQLDRLERATAGVADLRSRLSRVLVPEGPENVPQGPTPEPYRVSERIGTCASRITAIVDDVLKRLEV